ncbi:MAG: TonB-dependent receptor [Marinilabiliaceae bacterium]|nr:TonB-dependent receptor [Marinilabiliaceae bacterium]
MYFNRLLYIMLLMLSWSSVQAQVRHQVHGVVKNRLGEPLEYVTVMVKESQQGSTTTGTGAFSFYTTRSFPLVVVVSAIGYEGKEVLIQSADGLALLLDIRLDEKTEQIGDVNVTATQRGNGTFTRIDPNLTTLLPDAAGKSVEGLVKSQIGVASNNELSSQYRVRGGNYDENLVYVNGIEVYRPFLVRSGQQEGLSFANPDMVSSIQFSPGGFDVSYGDKLSSALDIRYKQPTSFAAGAQASLLGASAYLEGMSKNGRWSHLSGVRYKTNRYLLGSLDTKGDYSPTFVDVQSLLHFKISDQWSVDGLVNYSQNSYEFIPTDRETSFGTMSEVKRLTIYFEGQEKDLFQTGFGALAVNHHRDNSQYKLTLSAFRTFEEEAFDILGQYRLHDLDPVSGEASSDEPMTGIGIGSYLLHARNDLSGQVANAALRGTHQYGRHVLSWEAKVQSERFRDNVNEWELRDSAGYSLPYSGKVVSVFDGTHGQYQTQSARMTAFAMDNWSFPLGRGQMSVKYGVRGQYWDLNREWLCSPRFNVQYVPGGATRMQFRLATGIYYQPPFYKEMRNSDGKFNDELKAQKSVHYVAGGDWFFNAWGRPFKLTTELYYKHLSNLVSYQVDNVRIRYSAQNDADGYATGIDFKLNGEFVKGIESWASLSIMQTEENIRDDVRLVRQDDGAQTAVYPGYIPRPSDQRVNFALFFQDYLPNNPSFKVHLNLLFGTGLPFGPPRSQRYLATFRTPPYRRADIGFSKELIRQREGVNAHWLKKMWIGVEVFNLFDINNTISYYWVTDVSNRQYAVPNYLTSRRLNVQLTVAF